MKKYLHLVKTQISLVSTYRFELLTQWLYRLMSVGVYFSLWNLTAISTADSSKLLVYFSLYYLILEPLSTSKVAKWINEAALTGDLNIYLIKPINYPLTQIIRLISTFITRLSLPIIVFIFAVLLRPEIFAPVSLVNVGLFVLFLSLGITLWNLVMLNISVLSLHGKETGHTLTVFDLVLNLFKGAIIPAYLFPAEVTNILSFTPIPYLASFPIRLYQNDFNVEELLKGSVVVLVWIIIFFLLFQRLYKLGLKAYDAAGA